MISIDSMTSLPMSFQTEPDADELTLRGAFEAWLREAVRVPLLHLRLANTLSMLEHIGSVKIARTQAGNRITARTLRHLAEETRHAQVLKRIVHGIDPGAAPDYDDRWLLAGPTARGYFARLDASVRGVTRGMAGDGGEAAYLLVTWLVELRAAWLYPVYQSAMDDAGVRFSVRGIIGEEDRHLEEVEEAMKRLGLAGDISLPGLLHEERSWFRRLATAMMNDAGRDLPDASAGDRSALGAFR
ncbi:MAG: hypothetical protein JWQ98_2630 [Chlorobi bacterium]|nr:hypothetical protein [Chlorobiota bacterium]